MKAFQLLSPLLIVFLISCQPFSNHVDDALLQCGNEAKSYGNAKLLMPILAESSANLSWQAVAETSSGYQLLSKSSKGCVVVPEEVNGTIFLRHLHQRHGALFNSQRELRAGVQKLELSEQPEGLSPRALHLSCGSTATGKFAASFQLNEKPSTILHRYRLQYELYSTGANELKLASGQQNIVQGTAPSLHLPRILADGSYRLRFRLADVFEELHSGLEPEPVDCLMRLDTQPPEFTGFSEQLNLVTSGQENMLEVAPGQALNVSIQDASHAQIFTCLYERGAKPCESFTPLQGSLYAPDSGMWILRAWAEDEAGNRSGTKELLPFAVVHRDSMQNIDNLISLARLESQRGQALSANYKLLEAYDAFYGLKLPIEREPLRQKLGLAFSEVTRSQHLLFEQRDHSQSITKLELVGTGGSFASLDSAGHLVVRNSDGQLRFQANEVADFFPSRTDELIIAYKNGSIQRGFSGVKESWQAAPVPLTHLVFNEKDQRLLLAGPHGLALYHLQTAAHSLLWSQSLVDMNIQSASVGAQHLLVADKQKVLSFAIASGHLQGERAWDDRCSLVKMVETLSHGWFFALKTNQAAAMESDTEFHCELQRWDGLAALQRIDPAQVLRPDPFHEPSRYRFEEIETMSYSSARHWLAFGRNLDASYVIYDLKEGQAGVYQPIEDKGQVNALNFSPDGLWLAVNHSTLQTLNLWQIKDATLDSFSAMEPVLSLNGLSRAVVSLQIVPEKSWLLTADDARQVRIFHSGSTLLPRFQSEWVSARAYGESVSILRESLGRIQVIDPYGVVSQNIDKPNEAIFRVLQDPDGGTLALDKAGRLWFYPPISPGSWQLAFDGQITPQLFELSPSGKGILMAGRSQSGASQTFILAKTNGDWQQQSQLDFDARAGVWHPEETHVALLSPRESSLWTRSGRKVVGLSGRRGPLNNYSFQPFSDDGQRWLARVDQSIHIWDISKEQAIAPAIAWPRNFGFIGYADSQSDRLWIASTSSGRGQSIQEIDLNGRILRDFGEVDGGLLSIFQKDSKIWAFDSQGRLLLLEDARKGPVTLIDTKASQGEGLFSTFPGHDLVITRPADKTFAMLYTRDDVRQFKLLCQWLNLMLPADTALQSHRSMCARAQDLPVAQGSPTP